MEDLKDTGKATIALVCAFFFWLPLFNVLTSTVGLVFGILALFQIRKDPSHFGGLKRSIIAVIICFLVLLMTTVSYFAGFYTIEFA